MKRNASTVEKMYQAEESSMFTKDSPVESFLETFVHNLRLLDLQTKDYCQVIPELIFKKHKDIRL